MSTPVISTIIGSLVLMHLTLFSRLLDWGTNSLLFCAHLFFIGHGILYSKKLKNFKWVNYLIGYFILFVTLFALSQRPLLFILVVFAYSAFFRLRHLLAYLFIFLFSILVITAYWLQAFIIIGLFYFIILEIVKKQEDLFTSYMFGLGFMLLTLTLSPLLYLLFQASPQAILATWTPSLREALLNSLITSSISTAVVIIFGVPLGYCLAKKDFKAKPVVDALVDLPILVPQTAAGIAILVFLGPKTPLGEFFSRAFGLTLSGSLTGIIACQIFVSSPFLVRAAQSSFEDINPRLENVSRTLGATPFKTFLKISLPLAAPGIFNGCILAFARAFSEAGSLMVVAYRPFTIPIYTHDVFIQYGIEESIPVTIFFLIVCLWSFIVLKWWYEYRKKRILAI